MVYKAKSHDAWELFQTYQKGKRKGLPLQHLNPKDVDTAWVGSIIVAIEQARELPRSKPYKGVFDINFNARMLVFNARCNLVGEYFGSIGSQFKYEAGGLASGFYDWKAGMHGVSGKNPEPYAALHVMRQGNRIGLPTVGINNSNKLYKGKDKKASYINFHASGRFSRSSQSCLNIDRTKGNDENYLRFMSHFPRGSSGTLLVYRFEDTPPSFQGLTTASAGPLGRWRGVDPVDGLMTRRQGRRGGRNGQRQPLGWRSLDA